MAVISSYWSNSNFTLVLEGVASTEHHFSTTPGLPGWPFLGQISEIGPRFKLVGLLAFFWPHLKLADLKNVFGLLTLFWPFLRRNRFLSKEILLFRVF